MLHYPGKLSVLIGCFKFEMLCLIPFSAFFFYLLLQIVKADRDRVAAANRALQQVAQAAAEVPSMHGGVPSMHGEVP